MQLYEKITTGKRVSYKPYVAPVLKKTDFTDPELITLTATMGLIVLMESRMLMPEHKALARKIKKVEEAILDLTKGCGSKVDIEMTEHWVDCWNRCMAEVQRSITEANKEEVAA